MSLTRFLFGLVLGKRKPVVSGELRIPGVRGQLTIRRDRFGIPTLEAENDHDAYFGLGFVQAQDRGFQLECLLRVIRGQLSALVGSAALPIDRISRRLGFRRSANEQFKVLDADIQDALRAFVDGITAGFTRGISKLPHEYQLLKAGPAIWEPEDILALVKFETFLLPSNWDVELARLKILREDSPDALRTLEPAAMCFTTESQEKSTSHLDGFLRDLAVLHQHFPRGGGSNNWVISGSRTGTGKPILASDPHLSPNLPSHWYLAHVDTPTWKVAGAVLAGSPVFPIGHNGFCCWGVTAGLTDNTDLFLEKPSEQFPKIQEIIHVADAADVIEDVTITPRGPVLVQNEQELISVRAVWLDALPLRGFFDSPKARSFEEFRRPFAHWPCLPLNVVYADEAGNTGYQLIGNLPKRRESAGTMPLPAERYDWEGYVPFDEMPFCTNPPEGFFATANDSVLSGSRFGVDFLDPYRSTVIREELAKKDQWTIEQCQELQQNQRAKPWEDMREYLVVLSSTDPDGELGLQLLRDWDGIASESSPAATVFELLLVELCTRVAKAKAPKSWETVLGGSVGVLGGNSFADRRVGHLVHLIRTQATGWFARSWGEEIADAVCVVVRELRTNHGPGPDYWQWGDLRQLKLEHPIFRKHWLGRIFNLGPVPLGGDSNTVLQAGCRPLEPLENPAFIPNMRAVFDTSNWSNSRFVLAGGQSGNPMSDHFGDLFELWQRGESIPIPWGLDEVFRSSVASLRISGASGSAS